MKDADRFSDSPARLVTRKEALALLSISKSGFYRRIKEGIIPPPRHLGRTPVWRYQDIVDVWSALPSGAPSRKASR